MGFHQQLHGFFQNDGHAGRQCVRCHHAGDPKILEIVDAGVWNVGFTIALSIFAGPVTL